MKKGCILIVLSFVLGGFLYAQENDNQGSKSDAAVANPVDALIQSDKPLFRFVGQAASLVINDWIPLGNPETNTFDFGRLQTIPNYNWMEGVRLRAGIASNTRLHPHFFVKGYVAYGFKDEKLKYRGEAAWTFNNPAYHDGEYPKNRLRLIHENDVYAFGEAHPRDLNDRILVTFNRSKDALVYRDFTELNYERETQSGFAYSLWLRRSGFTPGKGLFFDRSFDDYVVPVEKLVTSEVGATLRYAFAEGYEQYKRGRRSTEIESPVFFLSHVVGMKDVLGSEVSYHRTEFSAQKRFLLGSFGRIDAVGEVMKVWNSVPFPFLAHHNQRQVHLIENTGYFLTKALEFMADELYTAKATFVGDDFLLSRVPIFNKLGMKELMTIRTSYGRLSDKNNPRLTFNGLLDFPSGLFEYGSAPYVEGAIGITNILGVLRVEYVHRFTYRDHPNAILGRFRADLTL